VLVKVLESFFESSPLPKVTDFNINIIYTLILLTKIIWYFTYATFYNVVQLQVMNTNMVPEA
jgi:hypothetical protein